MGFRNTGFLLKKTLDIHKNEYYMLVLFFIGVKCAGKMYKMAKNKHNLQNKLHLQIRLLFRASRTTLQPLTLRKYFLFSGGKSKQNVKAACQSSFLSHRSEGPSGEGGGSYRLFFCAFGKFAAAPKQTSAEATWDQSDIHSGID